MIYVDSNIFIFYAISDEKTEEKSFLSKNVLLKVAEGKLEASTSSLTWDELVWSVRKILGNEIALQKGQKFLEFPNLKILNVNQEVIGEAQRILEKYNIKPRDAIHASCAIRNNIKEIASDDPDFDKISELKRVKLE